jgi:hypothetical protein
VDRPGFVLGVGPGKKIPLPPQWHLVANCKGYLLPADALSSLIPILKSGVFPGARATQKKSLSASRLRPPSFPRRIDFPLTHNSVGLQNGPTVPWCRYDSAFHCFFLPARRLDSLSVKRATPCIILSSRTLSRTDAGFRSFPRNEDLFKSLWFFSAAPVVGSASDQI